MPHAIPPLRRRLGAHAPLISITVSYFKGPFPRREGPLPPAGPSSLAGGCHQTIVALLLRRSALHHRVSVRGEAIPPRSGKRQAVRSDQLTTDAATLPPETTWDLMTTQPATLEPIKLTVGNTFGLRSWVEYGSKHHKDDLGGAEYRVTD
jgi:hypothetical protein